MTTPDVASRLVKLLDALRDQTNRGRISWERTADERFETSFSLTSYAVATRDGDNRGPYMLLGYDSNGVESMAIDTSEDGVSAEVSGRIEALYLKVSGLVINKDLLSFLDSALEDVDPEPPF